MIHIFTPTTKETGGVVVFQPDGPQGARIGVQVSKEATSLFQSQFEQAKALKMDPVAFLESLKKLANEGIKVFDAASL